MEKKCYKCGIIKNLENFSHNTKTKDGFSGVCSDCRVKKVREKTDLSALLKRCSRCKQYKSIDLYVTDNKRRDKKSVYCKDCNNIYQRMWREKNNKQYKIFNQKSNLKKRYKMDLNRYNILLSKKNGLCWNEICNSKATDVDHDHNCCPGAYSCGKCVRGLLCNSCNTILGYMESDMQKVLGLKKYLELVK